MNTNTRLVGIAIALLTAGGLEASTLWSNGALNTTANGLNQNRCDSGPNACNSGSTASWTVFDNFNVPSTQGWVVSSFDFTDLIVNVSSSNYTQTNWSIWNGDPLNGGKLVVSGSGTANILSCMNGTACTFAISLTTPVLLTGGATYYLGTSNIVSNPTNTPNVETYREYANGGNTASACSGPNVNCAGTANNGLAQWEQSNGSISGTNWSGATPNSCTSGGPCSYVFPNASLSTNETATAFDIDGTLAPEPGTLTLMGLALAGGLCFIRRRRAA